ncbi:MAG: hypothetical protein GY928_18175 [Colwellia sp.]|nr:hypothetical protein [Colwellia sp.]
MQYFSSFSHTLCTTNEITEFSFNLKPIIVDLIPEPDAYITDQLTPIELAMEEITTLNSRLNKSEWTELRFNTDRSRDLLNMALESDLDSAIMKEAIAPAKAAAAKKLKVVLGEHPVDTKSAYDNESAQIRQRLAVLTMAENRELCELAGVSSVVDGIGEVQDKFDELLQNKLDEDSRKISGSVKTYRAVIVERLDNLLTFIGSNAVDHSEEYGAVATKLEELVIKTMTVAKARKSREENKDAVLA